MDMDKQKMANLLMLKTGVKYDINDPIFAIMEMNQILINECISHEKNVTINSVTDSINMTLSKAKDRSFYLLIICIFFSFAFGMAVGKFVL